MLLLGCASVQAYPGARRDSSAVAELRGFGSPCGQSLEYSNVDGRYAGTTIEVLPGPHTVTVEYTSEPFLSDEDRRSRDFVPCVYHSRHEIRLSVLAGQTYWFSVRLDGKQHVLSLFSSSEIGTEPGAQTPIEAVQLTFEKLCGHTGAYWQCFREEANDDQWWRHD